MQSIWHEHCNRINFPTLKSNLRTDVLVIGGGMAGILCAHKLNSLGIDCILIEQDKLLSGVTQNTTAKITAQHNLIYTKIYKKYGIEAAKLYLQANLSAVQEYKELGKKIECDMVDSTSYVYSEKNTNLLEKERDILGQIGYETSIKIADELPFENASALGFINQAQFNPLKFAYGISKELKIYENTRAEEISEKFVRTNYGKIEADHIIIATHFPLIDRHGLYFLKMYQQRSYVIAVKNIGELNGMYIDEKPNGFSFRSYRDTLLIGGGGHRTGERGGGYHAIERFIKENYPTAKEVTRFATQDCITLDEMPYIGRYFKRSKSLYVVTGFNKWGMTSSMLASNLLADIIMGNSSEYEKLFSPNRSILHFQTLKNTCKTVKNLVTPTVPRCSHLGCALKYNKQEKSWDCPCHGSRFNEKLEVINNPASKDIKEKK